MIEPFVNVLPVIMLEHESSSSVDGNLYPYCLASVDVDWGSTFELQLLMVQLLLDSVYCVQTGLDHK